MPEDGVKRTCSSPKQSILPLQEAIKQMCIAKLIASTPTTKGKQKKTRQMHEPFTAHRAFEEQNFTNRKKNKKKKTENKEGKKREHGTEFSMLAN